MNHLESSIETIEVWSLQKIVVTQKTKRSLGEKLHADGRLDMKAASLWAFQSQLGVDFSLT
jgi:hypothetical protein